MSISEDMFKRELMRKIDTLNKALTSLATEARKSNEIQREFFEKYAAPFPTNEVGEPDSRDQEVPSDAGAGSGDLGNIPGRSDSAGRSGLRGADSAGL